MSKETISNNYLAETKRKYLGSIVPIPKCGVVVGSDKKRNIGATIARHLNDNLWSVSEFDKDSWRPSWLSSEGPALSAMILANGNTHLDWIEDQPIDEIAEVIEDTLTTSIIATKLFVKATLGTPWPKTIIFIGSMAYRSVLNGSAPYCAAKAGLAHFARCVAWELAPKNYNVFCLHPSNTEGTPMTEKTIAGLQRYRNLTREGAEAYWGASLPRLEWLQPGDIASIVDFLLSGRADYLSGANLDLGGGQR